MHKAYEPRTTERRNERIRAAGELPAGAKVECPYCRALIDKPNYYYHLNFMHPNGDSKPIRSPHLERASRTVRNVVAKPGVNAKRPRAKASSQKTGPEQPDT